MTTELSSNAQAILLLTAPLIAGRGKPSVDPLTAGEYRRFARRLRELQREPADLLDPGASTLLKECRFDSDPERIERLLGRGFLLSQAMERWRTRAIWVVSRADAAYPQRVKKRLGEDAPPILYGCGDATLLDGGGLAVVGSRNVDDTLVEYTEEVGRLTAMARRVVISGGARGIDQAAMRGALEAGGNVMGILADSLEKAAVRREHREALMDGRSVRAWLGRFPGLGLSDIVLPPPSALLSKTGSACCRTSFGRRRSRSWPRRRTGAPETHGSATAPTTSILRRATPACRPVTWRGDRNVRGLRTLRSDRSGLVVAAPVPVGPAEGLHRRSAG